MADYWITGLWIDLFIINSLFFRFFGSQYMLSHTLLGHQDVRYDMIRIVSNFDTIRSQNGLIRIEIRYVYVLQRKYIQNYRVMRIDISKNGLIRYDTYRIGFRYDTSPNCFDTYRYGS